MTRDAKEAILSAADAARRIETICDMCAHALAADNADARDGADAFRGVSTLASSLGVQPTAIARHN